LVLKLILPAILFLAPNVPTHKARSYSKRIIKEASRRGVPPLVVVAIIHHETGGTWRTKLKSRTNDYGLMQVHVSRRAHKRYIGKEHKLYNPDVNIYWGVRFLYYSKRWHQKNCKDDHPWWAHYNWGFRVLRNRRYPRSVGKILARLKRRFVPPKIAQRTGEVSSAKDAVATVATGTSKSLIAIASAISWLDFGKTRTTRPSGNTRGGVRSSASCTRTRKKCGSTTRPTARTMTRRIDVRP
jgi:hypothetical protein